MKYNEREGGREEKVKNDKYNKRRGGGVKDNEIQERRGGGRRK